MCFKLVSSTRFLIPHNKQNIVWSPKVPILIISQQNIKLYSYYFNSWCNPTEQSLQLVLWIKGVGNSSESLTKKNFLQGSDIELICSNYIANGQAHKNIRNFVAWYPYRPYHIAGYCADSIELFVWKFFAWWV